MTMTIAHTNELLREAVGGDGWPKTGPEPLRLGMGSGCVDPELFMPPDGPTPADIEELVAFRVST